MPVFNLTQSKVSGGSGTYQSKTATPSRSYQYITPDSGYDALSQVTVNPATNSLIQGWDSNLVASNVKEGVNIFGVTGNCSGGGYVKFGTEAFSNSVLAITGLASEPKYVFASATENYNSARRAYYINNSGTIEAKRQNNTVSGIKSEGESWTTLTNSQTTGYYWDSSTGTFYISVRSGTSSSGTSAYVVAG